MRSMLCDALSRLADLIFRRPVAVIVAGSLLFLGGAWLAVFHLGVVSDTNALIRQDSAIHKYYLDYKKEFGVREELIVVVMSPDFEANKKAADFLGERFRQRPGDFQRVYYRHDFSTLGRKMLNYADEAQLKEISGKLKAYREILEKPDSSLDLNTMLDEVAKRFDEKYLRKTSNWDDFKPFIADFVTNLNHLADELEGKDRTPAVAAPGQESRDLDTMQRQMQENEYLSFDHGRILMILLTPTEGDKGTFSPYGDLIQGVRGDVVAAREAFPGLKIGLTGEPVLQDDEMRQSTQDSIFASILTFILISALFFFAYKELTRPALAILTLVIAVGWTFGITTLWVGHLNVISQACIIMILGLGIDFGIQMTGRYEEELAHKKGVQEALRSTMSHTGLAVLTGGSTTAVAFFTMCFNDFVGLAELGIIAGSGMVCCVVANLTVLPALLSLRDRNREEVLHHHVHVKPVFREELDRQVFSKPKLALFIVGVFTLILALGIPRIRYDYNLLNLQYPGMESVQYERALIDSPASAAIFGVIVADNVEDAKEKMARLVQLPTVRGVRSLTSLLPEGQEAKLPLLEEIKKQVSTLNVSTDVSKQVDVAKARESISELLENAKEARDGAEKYQKGVRATLAGIAKKRDLVDEAVELFDGLIPPLERAKKTFKGISQKEAGERLTRYQQDVFGKMVNEFSWLKTQSLGEVVGLEDLPEELRQRYLSPNGKVLIEVDPRENIWEQEADERFVADLRSVDPKATGTPVQNYQYINLLKDSYVSAAFWAFVAIVVLIGVHFRHIGRVVLTLLPLALGIVWTLGIMGWFGIAFNPANIITLPLVIGIGVAFGVYVVDRHREEGGVKLFGSSTGKAILLSAMTTIIGFSAMMTGKYVGLVSLGLVMTIGISCCFLTAAFVLPQFLSWRDNLKRDKEMRARAGEVLRHTPNP